MSKFEEFANKAKEKVAEVAEQAKNYDYKGKAEELKEKANDMAENVKSFDYKGEAENIKKGGFKYFWSKYKFASIVAASVLVVLILIVNLFGGSGYTESGHKIGLSNDEIITCTRATLDANILSNNSGKYVGASIIGQDDYGRCAAILEYDFGGIMGRKKYYVFSDGLTKDDKINVKNGIVEQSMNNSSLQESVIKARKEKFNWNVPR